MSVPPPPPPDRGPGAPPGGRFEVDVAIVGAGVAGLFAALRLRDAGDARIVILDKGEPGPSGSSPWAQGGVAVAVGPEDDPQLHAEDTIRAGGGLCDPRAVEVLTQEGPAAVERLLELGAEFDRAPDGGLHLAREGGQRVARSVHRADATGAEMVRALRTAVSDGVHRLGGIVVALDTAQGAVHGVWVLTEDGPAYVRAGAVLLASGGCGGLFAATTNPDRATGDGLSLAWRAGVALRDLEFVQFHPTGLAPSGGRSPGWRLLLTEALRGAGATLHDRDGRRFLIDVHPQAELAPRHVVARAILSQPDGIAYLDATDLGARRLEEEFPTAVQGAREHGFDLTTERAPVTPAAHYQIGGVRTDLQGRTSLPGLWAAGEVASTGAHGANRMAGNSLLEALVFGGRAAVTIAREAGTAGDTDRGATPSFAAEGPSADELGDLRGRLRRAIWDGCGPTRSRRSLAEAAATVTDLAAAIGVPRPDPRHVELAHAVTAAGLLIRSASLRTETRGVHVRDDHPDPDPAWADTHLELVRT